MKILLLAKVPAYYQLFCQPDQLFPQFQAQAFWLKALKKLDHKVKVFRYSDNLVLPQKLTAWITIKFQRAFPYFYSSYRQIRNRFYQFFPKTLFQSIKLKYLINSFKPEAIIISGGISELLSFPLKYAKRSGSKIYFLYGEDPKISATKFEKNNFPLFDWIITNDLVHAFNWKKLGAKQTKALPYTGINPQIHKKLKLTQKQKKLYKSDLVFIGTLSLDRQKILSQLTEFNLRIYGYIPPGIFLLNQLKRYYFGEAWGEKIVKIYNASKIILNFIPSHMPKGSNARTFEIPGCGAFQLVSRCPRNWLKPNKEIILFNSIKDLKEKIKYYLTYEKQRKKIALAGYNRVNKDHTYIKRFSEILALS